MWIKRTAFAQTMLLLCAAGAPIAAPSDAVADVLRTVTNYLHATVVEPPKTIRLANGTAAGTAVFRQTQWELKSMPQSLTLSSRMESEAIALPEAERLKRMDRFDDYTQIWFVSLREYPQAGETLKNLVPRNQQSNRFYRELAFLGKGRGYAWYAEMPIYDWTYLQKYLRLTGGDNPLAAAVRGAAIDDLGNRTRGSAEEILTSAGAKAIPYIKQILVSTNFGIGLSALGPMKERQATALLLESAASSNAALATGARSILESYPRAEAENLYLQWLERDAGKEPVFRTLTACAKVAPNKLAPYLPRILESPKSIYVFRQAFELSRSLAGKSIPARLLKLENEIKEYGYASSTNFSQAKVDQAVGEILKSADVEAAAVIGIMLATATTKGDWRAANRAGIAILQNLPNNYGRKTAKRVADSIPDNWMKDKLKQVELR